MLRPQFLYEENEVDYEDGKEIYIQNKEGNFHFERNKEAEKAFHEMLRTLHPTFSKQLFNPFFYLPFSDVMKGNWFLKTIRRLQEENTTVKGMENLKKFRYNTAIPKWENEDP